MPTDPARMAMNWQQELLAQTIAAAQPAAKKVSAPIAHIPTNPSADRVDPRPFLPKSPRSILPTLTRTDPAARSQSKKAKGASIPVPKVGPNVVHSKATVAQPKMQLDNLNAKNLPKAELLEELAARFVTNCPPEELKVFERLMFLVEQAHWYYEDFVRVEQPNLKTLRLRDFTELMFHKVKALAHNKGRTDEIYKKFTNYKFSVPTGGVIILNPKLDKVLMVKGYKANSGWGFPKGKINKDEPEADCAAREVTEEVGVDFRPWIKEDDSIVMFRTIDSGLGLKQRSRLFIVPGISEQTPFATLTRKEISGIAWHPLTMLAKDGRGAKYFFCKPYLQPLLQWIKNYKKKMGKAAFATVDLGLMPATPGGDALAPAQMYTPKGAAPPGDRFPSLSNFTFDVKKVNKVMAAA